MKKAGKAGLLCLLLISLLGACSPKNRIEETESTESSQEKIQLHRLANDKSQLRRKLPKVKDCIKSLSAKVISLNSIIKYGVP